LISCVLYTTRRLMLTPANTLVISNTRRPPSGPSPLFGATEAKHLREPIGTPQCLNVRVIGLSDVAKGLHKTAILNLQAGTTRKMGDKKVSLSDILASFSRFPTVSNSCQAYESTSAEHWSSLTSSEQQFSSSQNVYRASRDNRQ
jgi:hypothetical protein